MHVPHNPAMSFNLGLAFADNGIDMTHAEEALDLSAPYFELESMRMGHAHSIEVQRRAWEHPESQQNLDSLCHHVGA